MYIRGRQTGGGTTISPSQVYKGCVKSSSTLTYTINSSKHYVITTVTRVNGADSRGASWYINAGVLTTLQQDSTSGAVVTLSGTTLSMKGGNASYNDEFRIIRLD